MGGMYIIFAVVHVALAVFIVGPMAILPMVGMKSMRTGQREQVLSVAKSTRLFSWLSILVVVFGYGLLGMGDSAGDVTDMWVLVSIGAWLIALLLSLIVVAPKMIKAAEPRTDISEAKPRGYAPVAAASGISTLMLIIVVVMMVWQP